MRPYPLLLVLAACGSPTAEAPPPADPASQAATAAPSTSAIADMPAPAPTTVAPPAPADGPKLPDLKQKIAGQVPLFGFTDPKPKSKGMCWEMFGTRDQLADVEKNRAVAAAAVVKKFRLGGAKMLKSCPTAGTVPGLCVSAVELGVHFDQKVFTPDQAKAACKDDQMGVWLDAMP